MPVLGHFLARQGWIPDWPDNVEHGDIVSGLPVKSGSCHALYCSHVLDYLALEDLRKALKNTYEYLRPGGTFRFVLADLEYFAREYIESEAVGAAQNLMEKTGLGKHARPRGFIGIVRVLFGNSTRLWMWDYKAMSHELKQVGFEDIRRAEFGDSHDPIFGAVEDMRRWENSLGIECKKSLN